MNDLKILHIEADKTNDNGIGDHFDIYCKKGDKSIKFLVTEEVSKEDLEKVLKLIDEINE